LNGVSNSDKGGEGRRTFVSKPVKKKEGGVEPVALKHGNKSFSDELEKAGYRLRTTTNPNHSTSVLKRGARNNSGTPDGHSIFQIQSVDTIPPEKDASVPDLAI
jgi:hypothetical protein